MGEFYNILICFWQSPGLFNFVISYPVFYGGYEICAWSILVCFIKADEIVLTESICFSNTAYFVMMWHVFFWVSGISQAVLTTGISFFFFSPAEYCLDFVNILSIPWRTIISQFLPFLAVFSMSRLVHSLGPMKLGITCLLLFRLGSRNNNYNNSNGDL